MFTEPSRPTLIVAVQPIDNISHGTGTGVGIGTPAAQVAVDSSSEVRCKTSCSKRVRSGRCNATYRIEALEEATTLGLG
jgi:hypothetical protein